MKIVINACYGGFSLSPLGIKRLAELKGRPCFFFRQESYEGPYIDVPDPTAVEGVLGAMFLRIFDIPNPNEVLPGGPIKEWFALPQEERDRRAGLSSKHSLTARPDDRTDADLIRVVEELGSEAASGACAALKVIEVPDGTDWELDEYDGIESVSETHQTWS